MELPNCKRCCNFEQSSKQYFLEYNPYGTCSPDAFQTRELTYHPFSVPMEQHKHTSLWLQGFLVTRPTMGGMSSSRCASGLSGCIAVAVGFVLLSTACVEIYRVPWLALYCAFL